MKTHYNSLFKLVLLDYVWSLFQLLLYVDCLFLPITDWNKHVLEGWKCMGMIRNQMDFLQKKTK